MAGGTLKLVMIEVPTACSNQVDDGTLAEITWEPLKFEVPEATALLLAGSPELHHLLSCTLGTAGMSSGSCMQAMAFFSGSHYICIYTHMNYTL